MLARGQAKQIRFFDALIHGASPIFLFPGLGKSLKVLRRSDALGSSSNTAVLDCNRTASSDSICSTHVA